MEYFRNGSTHARSLDAKKKFVWLVSVLSGLNFSLWLCKTFSLLCDSRISLSCRKFKSKLLRHKNTHIRYYHNPCFFYLLLNSSKFYFSQELDIFLSFCIVRFKFADADPVYTGRIVFSGMYSHAQNEEHVERDISLYVSATLRVHVVFSEFTRSIEFHALVLYDRPLC